MRSLAVFAEGRHVGTLSEGDDLWSFEYAATWADDPAGFDLSPALARSQRLHLDGGTLRPVQWYFDNLLPEELLRQAIEKEANIRGDDAFALLEYLGAESAGSLTLLPAGTTPSEEPGWRVLEDADLSARIRQLPRSTLTRAAPKRMSLAGAQHKLLVVAMGGMLYEPMGATPSTHILKPDHVQAGTSPASAFLETMTMRLAQEAKLLVPAFALRRVPEPVYIITRFDRQTLQDDARGAGPGLLPPVRRLHVIDACQLLNKARGFKHLGASLESLKAIIDRCTNKIDTRLRLFRWLTFNVLVANDDCHLKNLSFSVSAGGIALAPHYDLLATGVYHTKAIAEAEASWPRVPLAIGLPDARFFGDVTLARLLAAGEALGVAAGAGRRIVSEVCRLVAKGFERIRAEHDERERSVVDAAATLAVAAEGRVLRVFQHIILPEMLQRLGVQSGATGRTPPAS